MFLLEVEESYANTVVRELEGTNLEVDPRPIHYMSNTLTFEVTYSYGHATVATTFQGKNVIHKTIVTLTITSQLDEEAKGWLDTLYFRVYDPTKEVVPSFTSTTYTYQGLKDERAPEGTIKGIIHESVTKIQENAFMECKQMKVCVMHDNIEEIDNGAFFQCESLQTINKLPSKLRRLGEDVFMDCTSLDAIFIPPSIEIIDWEAFSSCCRLRVLSLPPNLTAQRIGERAFLGCNALINSTRRIIPYDAYDYVLQDDNSEDVHESIMEFCQGQPPLHQACLATNVTAQSIHDCVDAHGPDTAFIIDHNGMTPLHILAINPHATTGSILACLDLNINAAAIRDGVGDFGDGEDEDDNDGRDNGDNNDDTDAGTEIGMTAMDYLWKYENIDSLICLVQALCLHRQARLPPESLST